MESAPPIPGQALHCVSETGMELRQHPGRDWTGVLQERVGEDREMWREEKRHRKSVAEKDDRPLTKQTPGTLSVRNVSALIT